MQIITCISEFYSKLIFIKDIIYTYGYKTNQQQKNTYTAQSLK